MRKFAVHQKSKFQTFKMSPVKKFICAFCEKVYDKGSSFYSHMSSKHPIKYKAQKAAKLKQAQAKLRKVAEKTNVVKDMFPGSAEDEIDLVEAVEEHDMGEVLDDHELGVAGVEHEGRVKQIDDMKSFSKSLDHVVIVPESRWLGCTMGAELGNMLARASRSLPGLVEAPACGGCDMRTMEIKEHDKIIQSKNEELYEKDVIIKELGGILELMASCTPEGQVQRSEMKEPNEQIRKIKVKAKVKVTEMKHEISMMKEVEIDMRRTLVLQDAELVKRDKDLEMKKEIIKKMKLKEIDLKEEIKSLNKNKDAKKGLQDTRPVPKAVQKNKETAKNTAQQSQQDEIKCTKCGKKENSKSDLMIHMDLVHTREELVQNTQNKEWPTLKQGEACKNGDGCSWLRNNKCRFVHNIKSDVRSHKKAIHSEAEPCKNGPNCGYRRNNACKFSHQENNHGRWEEQPKQHGFRKHNNKEHREEEPVRKGNVRNPGEPVGWCLDGGNCRRQKYCMYKHTEWQHENLSSFLKLARQSRN